MYFLKALKHASFVAFSIITDLFSSKSPREEKSYDVAAFNSYENALLEYKIQIASNINILLRSFL